MNTTTVRIITNTVDIRQEHQRRPRSLLAIALCALIVASFSSNKVLIQETETTISHHHPLHFSVGNLSTAVQSPLLQTTSTDWYMAGANPQRTSWISEGVDPTASSEFGVEWYRPIEAYIGQHIQLVTARDKIYVSTARGVYALDASSGDEVWRYNTEMPIGHSPTVVEDTLYVAGFDKRVYALNADTGDPIWVFEAAKGGFSTNPLVIEGKVLLGSRDGYFYALNKDNGNLLWQYPSNGETPIGPILYSAAYKDEKVFFASNNNYAYALNVNDGTLIWKSEKVMPGDGYQAWWPVVYKNYVIFSSALAYTSSGNPGAHSVINVVAPNDPYYSQMHDFQYGDSVIKSFQRDDVFHQDEPDDSKLGPEFITGSSDDSTAIEWSWGSGKTVIDAAKVTEYLEDDGQIKLNRPTNKPWRRGVIVLNITDGAEYTFDSDNDGNREYAPFLFAGTYSGNRYPPVIIPTRDDAGNNNEVIYAQNFDQYQNGWSISRAKLTGWQFGTSYLHPVGGSWAIDEPFANSAGGVMLYGVLCCDRIGKWQNLETGTNKNLWDYHRTLESIKIDWEDIQYYMASLTPGYDEMWQGASMWEGLPRLFGNYGTTNGIYHNHGIQNPLIPYEGRLFVHRSNAIIAFGPNPVSIRQRTQDETPEEYEENIQQEFPHVARPLLEINNPNQAISSTLTIQDIQSNLDYEIAKMLQKGHLRPGYYNGGTQRISALSNYFENPGDTLYTLTQAYPYVSETTRTDLEKYIKQHYKMYFEDNMYARTGFWIDAPNNYNLDNIDDFGQLQAREWMPLPPEVTEDIKSYKASIYTGYNWPWNYPQHNIYAMWEFARIFYSNDSIKLEDIYNKAKNNLDTTPPDADTLHNMPWVHNGYISGYIGFLNLQKLAGQENDGASLKATIETELDNLLTLRSNDFRKDHPVNTYWSGKKRLNLARNFMNMSPELGDHLYENAFNEVKEAVDEYNWIAPYWVATRYEASFSEFSSDNLYTHPAMFQAKAYIIKEPVEQLLKYIDSPAFGTGDLFYIQNLVAILDSYYNVLLKVEPSLHAIDPSETAVYTIQVGAGFTDTVTLSMPNPPSDLVWNLNPVTVEPPGTATLTLTDKHSGPTLLPGVWYTISIVGTDSVQSDTVNARLLVGGQQFYMPLIFK